MGHVFTILLDIPRFLLAMSLFRFDSFLTKIIRVAGTLRLPTTLNKREQGTQKEEEDSNFFPFSPTNNCLPKNAVFAQESAAFQRNMQ